MASSESSLPKFQPRETKPEGRFAGLRRSAERIEAGTIAPHPEMPTTAAEVDELERQSTAKPSTLRDKLGARKPSEATVRMSVEMPVEMHQQITAIATRAGLAKAEVVREILREVLPDLVG